MRTLNELAKDAGFEWNEIGKRLERFAALVRAEREWVDLTDDEILAIAIQYDAEDGVSDVEYGSRVIAAFKEKNTCN